MNRCEMEAEARRLLEEALRQGKLDDLMASTVDKGLALRLRDLRRAVHVRDVIEGGRGSGA